MLRNWVKETTSNANALAISLSGAVDNSFVAFGTVFSNGETVYYTVEDGNNRENGVGVFNTGTPNTITRTTVLETLVLGVLDDTAPAAITMTASATVSVTSSALHLMPAPGECSPSTAYILSGYQSPVNLNVSLTANRLYAVPFRVLAPVSIASVFMLQLATLDAGKVARIGLYNCNTAGLPGTVFLEGNTAISLSATGYFLSSSLAANKLVPPGRYYIGLLTDSAAGIVQGSDTGQITPDYGRGGSRIEFNGYIYSITAGWTSMPDLTSATASDLGYAQSPRVGLER